MGVQMETLGVSTVDRTMVSVWGVTNIMKTFLKVSAYKKKQVSIFPFKTKNC